MTVRRTLQWAAVATLVVLPACGSAAATTTPPDVPIAPPAVGAYGDQQTGSITFGPLTEKVLPASRVVVADGPGQTQVWSAAVFPHLPAEQFWLRYTAHGVVMTKFREPAPTSSFTMTCTFATPLPAPAWPIQVGATFSGTAQCPGSTLTARGTVVRGRDAVIAGRHYATYDIDTAMSFAGDLVATGTETDAFAPRLRLPVAETLSISGTFKGAPFSIQLDKTFTSAVPARPS